MKGKSTEKKRVDFYFNAPGAKEVYLAGDFNNWDASSLRMYKDSKGKWRKQLTLLKGVYQYKFIVDGQWVHDPNKETIPNLFGSFNNIVRV